MNKEEIIKNFNIPPEMLEEYKTCQCCCKSSGQGYDNNDVERLSQMITLSGIGFSCEEVKNYMDMLSSQNPTKSERLKILTEKRCKILNEIHLREKQLDTIDCLRFKIKKEK